MHEIDAKSLRCWNTNAPQAPNPSSAMEEFLKIPMDV
jgi:hypothetical protein